CSKVILLLERRVHLVVVEGVGEVNFDPVTRSDTKNERLAGSILPKKARRVRIILDHEVLVTDEEHGVRTICLTGGRRGEPGIEAQDLLLRRLVGKRLEYRGRSDVERSELAALLGEGFWILLDLLKLLPDLLPFCRQRLLLGCCFVQWVVRER